MIIYPIFGPISGLIFFLFLMYGANNLLGGSAKRLTILIGLFIATIIGMFVTAHIMVHGG